MDILDRISLLLGNREQKELTDYLGLKAVAFSEWKSGKSKSYRKYLIEIAEFFSVSIDYLVYGKNSTMIEVPKPQLTENEEEMLSLLNQLSERDQIRLLGRVEGIVKEYGVKSNTEENAG